MSIPLDPETEVCMRALGAPWFFIPCLVSPPTPAQEPHGPIAEFRRIDGSGNHPTRSGWGSAGSAMVRATRIGYADGRSEPAGPGRASARSVSNAVAAQEASEPNRRGVSDFVWQWGQFLDHDLVLTPVALPAELDPIAVPIGDPYFDPTGSGEVTIAFERSLYDDSSGVRQQLNDITAFIDASNVYGSDARRARELRTLDGTGRLKTSAGELLPFNLARLPNAPSDSPRFFLAGDFRANEQVGLTVLHTLFVREHNYWAELIVREGWLPRLPRRAASGTPDRLRRGRSGRDPRGERGELIYQTARAIVGAEMQAITYREFLPVLLGEGALRPYAGYDPTVNPGIRNVFATAAYRFGHSMLSPELLRLQESGDPIRAGHLPLAGAFFAPELLLEDGRLEPYLRGLVAQRAQAVDGQLVDAVRNFLFGPPGSVGFDLAALNIQRGRDHGLPGFNQVRSDYGLDRVRTFAEITRDEGVQRALERAYGSVDEIDPWVGGLCEDALPGALVGPTVRAVLVEQFEALRDGDRFWYERHLPAWLVQRIESQRLSDVLRRNTELGPELPGDVFFAAG